MRGASFADGIPTECAARGHGRGEWTLPLHMPRLWSAEPLLPQALLLPPAETRAQGGGGLIRACPVATPAVSHAAAYCSGETRSQEEAITGTDPGQTQKPALGVALGEQQQKIPAESPGNVARGGHAALLGLGLGGHLLRTHEGLFSGS